MKKMICILLFQVSFNPFFGQTNLVPNPSFESYTSCPAMTNQVYKAFPWYNPTGSTPDYFNSCGYDSTGMANPGIPTNIAGYQPARTGNAYAGIGMTTFANEYLGIKLDSALKPYAKYCVEFYVSLWNYSIYSTSSLGVYFSNAKLTDFTTITILPVTPQVENPATNLLSDTTDWMLVSGSFISNGGEQYMTIGSFVIPSEMVIDTTYPSNIDGNIYYYVDDVSVTSCPDPPKEDLLVPTLLSGNQIFEIKGLEGISELFIYNTLGCLFYSLKLEEI